MLITEKYPAVVATRFRLQTRTMVKVDGKQKQIWDINCKSRIHEGKKLQISGYIEEMNSIDSNIYFEIDVDATEEAHEYLAEKLKAKALKEKDSNLTTNEAIGKLAEAISEAKTPKKAKKVEAPEDLNDDIDEIQELRAEYFELAQKKPHSLWKETTLKEKIEELKS
jgi:type II secretory pathway component GspD/PulD (secretin)